ncbi:MAG: aminoacetone oxidase family FAD-binding enzyme [Bacteroidales bacterium]|nr:aminoacetone oxidase family FAD-binding enzyme [Bacteroidales bacterium]
MDIAIIGAGAAGCFCAIELKRRLPSASVEVFESGPRPLAKVAITGGGRCNLTNSFEGLSSLKEAYPRGDKLMRRVFSTFNHEDTWRWFESEGVDLVLQEDRCVFPASQDAMQIVNLLTGRMRQLGVVLHTGTKIGRVAPLLDEYDAVVVTTGGSPKAEGFGFLDGLGLEIVPPVPSLFTFNLPGSPVRELMGTVVENATASIAGTKFKASGPLLVTHWGMSGPAILKLSSYAARFLSEASYHATLLVNWLGEKDETEVRKTLESISNGNLQKLVVNARPEEIPSRLWTYLVAKSRIREDSRWAETGQKGLNRLVEAIMNDSYSIQGQSRFKEEFVTCGGVALSNLDSRTLECKNHPGLYFAGEVLDVDAITGGFNLQAAWSMGYRVAVSIAEK